MCCIAADWLQGPYVYAPLADLAVVHVVNVIVIGSIGSRSSTAVLRLFIRLMASQSLPSWLLVDGLELPCTTTMHRTETLILLVQATLFISLGPSAVYL